MNARFSSRPRTGTCLLLISSYVCSPVSCSSIWVWSMLARSRAAMRKSRIDLAWRQNLVHFEKMQSLRVVHAIVTIRQTTDRARLEFPRNTPQVYMGPVKLRMSYSLRFSRLQHSTAGVFRHSAILQNNVRLPATSDATAELFSAWL